MPDDMLGAHARVQPQQQRGHQEAGAAEASIAVDEDAGAPGDGGLQPLHAVEELVQSRHTPVLQSVVEDAQPRLAVLLQDVRDPILPELRVLHQNHHVSDAGIKNRLNVIL